MSSKLPTGILCRIFSSVILLVIYIYGWNVDQRNTLKKMDKIFWDSKNVICDSISFIFLFSFLRNLFILNRFVCLFNLKKKNIFRLLREDTDLEVWSFIMGSKLGILKISLPKKKNCFFMLCRENGIQRSVGLSVNLICFFCLPFLCVWNLIWIFFYLSLSNWITFFIDLVVNFSLNFWKRNSHLWNLFRFN